MLATMKVRTLSIVFLATLVAGLACAGEPNAGTGSAPEDLLRNGRMPVEGVLTGGQPTTEQLEALRAAGYETLLNLRTEGESGNTSRDVAEAMGFTYVELPIAGADGLTPENVKAFAELLEEAKGPTVVHCGSGNRVGAMFALKAAWVDGASPQEALELGKAAGLTGLEPAVVEKLGASGQ